MRTIKLSAAFKRDFKHAKKTPHHRKNIDALLTDILDLLVEDQPLPATNRDHALTGNWDRCRECHVKPDLLLIYQKIDDDTLRLVRLGSHSELFG